MLNPDVPGEERMTVFRRVLIDSVRELMENIGKEFLTASPDAGITIIELDSSSKIKFSRHLIITLETLAFRDIVHVGFFV